MTVETADFLATLRDALKNYDDPAWLGENSPLATPYFLGAHLESVHQPQTIKGRGEALRQALYEAAQAIWPGVPPQSRGGLWDAVETERQEMGNGGPRYLFLILDLRFFRVYYPPRTPPAAGDAIFDLLTVSSSAFYRHLDQAVEALVNAFLKLIRPGMRLERPVLNHSLIGRDTTLKDTLSNLKAKNSVTLSGVGGIGKSSLGAATVASWPGGHSFWYTIRPGLNDDLNSLLFSLGHFLQQYGPSGLWLQLVASEGKIESVEMALGLLREDLDRPDSASILLCFDEIDLLQTGASQPRHGEHGQVLELLEGLVPITPILLIGRRAVIDTPIHVALNSLTEDDIQLLMQDRRPDLTGVDPAAIHKATDGNPRLVELLLAFDDIGDPQFLRSMHRHPSLKPLFHRLWKRLSAGEKEVLASLSVFRAYAPRERWADHPGFEDLNRRDLIKKDAYGGIALLPIFRQLIYEQIPPHKQQELHEQAARLRGALAQYTAAAYHFVQAGQTAAAVQLWSPVQDAEIAQGKAGEAYALFNAIPGDQVSGKDARMLRIIQNRLNLLYGELEKVLAGMETYSWHVDEDLNAIALEQWGDAQHLSGDAQGAKNHYEEAISLLGRLSNQIVTLQIKRGKSFLGEANHVDAQRAAVLAQYEVERFRALIEINRGRHRQAMDFLLKAQELAHSIEDEKSEATAYELLAVAAGNLGQMEQSQQYAQAAMDYFDKVGNRLRLEGMRAEMAGMYLNVGRFADVIEPAERALAYFEKIKHSHWPGHISSNLAEAYFETGHLDKAEQYARRAMATENPPVQPYALYTLGQVFQARGDASAADYAFKTGLQWAERNEDVFIEAYLHKILGKFLLEQERLDEGREQLQTALQLFTRLGIALEEENTSQLLKEINST